MYDYIEGANLLTPSLWLFPIYEGTQKEKIEKKKVLKNEIKDNGAGG